MATSNQYNFANIDADYVVRDAFERCGIANSKINPIDFQSGLRSLNFVLSEWINYGLNLFTVQTGLVPLISGQSKYSLPAPLLSDILEVNAAKSNTIFGGTAYSTVVAAGTPASLFQSTPGQCTLATANGSFWYIYPQGQPILYVGILSNSVQTYTIEIQAAAGTITEGENDPQWQTILLTPPTTYYPEIPIWYVLPYTITALNWQIRETNGAILDLAQISLQIPYQIQPMEPCGRDLFFQFNTNNQTGIPTQYWFDRTATPSLNVYTFANNSYQFLIYNYTQIIQDMDSFFNSLPVTSRFLNAVCAALAVRLAEKFVTDPNLYAQLLQASITASTQALGEDTERVTSQMTISRNRY
jgi:hypothetical protein